MSGRRVLGAAVVWLVVVASVSALVWVVISRAGNDLVTSNEPVTTTEGATSPARRTTSRAPSHPPSHTPSRTPSTDASPTPGNDGSNPSPTPSPSSPSSPSSTSATPASPTTPSPSATPVAPPSPTASAQRSTWQGRPGTIEVSCGGAGIRLVSAQPATGFRAEVHREDDRIEVDLEGREDEDGTKVTVVARCQGGVPSFSVAAEPD